MSLLVAGGFEGFPEVDPNCGKAVRRLDDWMFWNVVVITQGSFMVRVRMPSQMTLEVPMGRSTEIRWLLRSNGHEPEDACQYSGPRHGV